MSRFFLDSIEYLKGVDKRTAIKEEIINLRKERNRCRNDEGILEELDQDIEVLEVFLESY